MTEHHGDPTELADHDEPTEIPMRPTERFGQFPSINCDCHIHETYGFVAVSGCAEHDTPAFSEFLQRIAPKSTTGIEMREQLIIVEDFLRSVLAVAARDGKQTNWEPFRAKATKVLKGTQDTLGWKFIIEGGDTCTALTFRGSH